MYVTFMVSVSSKLTPRATLQIADGWYISGEFGLIKAVVRRKHFNLLQGKVISDNDCADLFVEGGLSSSNNIIRIEPASTSKRFPRKSKSKRRPIAPEKLMVSKCYMRFTGKGLETRLTNTCTGG